MSERGDKALATSESNGAPGPSTGSGPGRLWWLAMSERGDDRLATGESNGAPGRTRTCGPRLRRPAGIVADRDLTLSGEITIARARRIPFEATE